MNEADINQRLNELTQMETGLTNEIGNIQKALTQKQADLFAVQGAKQDCSFWMAKILAPKTESAAPTLPPAVLNAVKKANDGAADGVAVEAPIPAVKKAITNK